MIVLYYSPGACSLASHIVAEESGLPYEGRPVRIAKGENRDPWYLELNPKGRVPLLTISGSVLTESVAILMYLGSRQTDPELVPTESIQRARCLSWVSWLSSTVHPAFRNTVKPENVTSSEGEVLGIKEANRGIFWSCIEEINGQLCGSDWILGEHYTIADAHTLVFFGWAVRLGLPVQELANLSAWRDRMLMRPAVRRVLEREDSPLLRSS